MCRILRKDEYRVAETGYWDVQLAFQQMRVGRCMTILKRHAERESHLSADEWIDLYSLRQRLHPALHAAFGATHLSM